MPDKPSFESLSVVVNQAGKFSAPAAKIETFSAAVGAFLEPYKDIFWGMKYIIMPSIIVIMCLVIGITITIGVRERWTEMAVMKVLGFQPWQVMAMIISEAMLIGVFSGLLSTWSVYFLPKAISWFTRTVGVKFAFFDNFNMPPIILIGGPVLGLFVAMMGAALPSWNARKVKVSEVFAQVA
jgi:putative ABC transport system permease protein